MKDKKEEMSPSKEIDQDNKNKIKFMKGIGGTRSTQQNITIKSLNESIGSVNSRTSLNKFNTTINQKKHRNMITSKRQENKKKDSPPQKEHQRRVLNFLKEKDSSTLNEQYKKHPHRMTKV